MNIRIDGAKLLLTDFRRAELQGFNLKISNLKGTIFTPQQLEMLAEEIEIQILEASK